MLVILKQILADLEKAGGITRTEVEKINMKTDNIIGNIIPSNAFTTLKTTTNYEETKAILENTIADLSLEEGRRDLLTITKEMTQVDNFTKSLYDLFEEVTIDEGKIKTALSEERLSVYVGEENKVLVNLIEEKAVIALTENPELFIEFSGCDRTPVLLERFKISVETLEQPTLFMSSVNLGDVVRILSSGDIIKELTRIKEKLMDKLIKEPYDYELNVNEEWLLDLPKNTVNYDMFELLMNIFKVDNS